MFHILVVEDDSELRNLFCTVLEKKGYIYFSIGTGRAKHINLTDEGKILIREKIYPIIKCENNSFSLLTEQEQTFVLNIFDKYIHSLHTEFNKLKNLHRR